jgi:hypothetical protein
MTRMKNEECMHSSNRSYVCIYPKPHPSQKCNGQSPAISSTFHLPNLISAPANFHSPLKNP